MKTTIVANGYFTTYQPQPVVVTNSLESAARVFNPLGCPQHVPSAHPSLGRGGLLMKIRPCPICVAEGWVGRTSLRYLLPVAVYYTREMLEPPTARGIGRAQGISSEYDIMMSIS